MSQLGLRKQTRGRGGDDRCLGECNEGIRWIEGEVQMEGGKPGGLVAEVEVVFWEGRWFGLC